MTANPILLQKKYSRVISAFAGRVGLSLDEALDFFYYSDVYRLISEGVSDMHCMSDDYLAEELELEYREKKQILLIVEVHFQITLLKKIVLSFGFKKENYEFSQNIGSKLFDNIRYANPDYVATECETCKWQIEMSTGFQVMNPICILADALDVEETQRLNQIR